MSMVCSQMFKELVLNQNLMFLLVVIGVVDIKMESMHGFDDLIIVFSSFDSIMLGIDNVVCEDKK